MSVGADAFQPTMSDRHAWTIDAANFTHVLSIGGGTSGTCSSTPSAFPAQLTAVVDNQFPTVTIEETGEKVPYAGPNEVMIIGTLEQRGLVSVQLEGAQRHRTGCRSTPPVPTVSCASRTPAAWRTRTTTLSWAWPRARRRSRRLLFPLSTRYWRRLTWTPACRTSPTSMPRTGGTGRTAPQKRLTSETPWMHHLIDQILR